MMFYNLEFPLRVPEEFDQEAKVAYALRTALTHLPVAVVRFDTGATGANWFQIMDVEVIARGVKDCGLIIVRLQAASPPIDEIPG